MSSMLPACPDSPSSNPNRLTHASAWPGLASSFLFRPVLSCRPAAESSISPVRSPRPSGRASSSTHRRDWSNVNCPLLPRVSARVDEPMSNTPMNQCKCTS
ncbi:hypothetical protein CGRA01v4_11436 [Colletotrichum graminicola]|nr:hypothetical protein CGRA01v4_11436 [Colletotrichum graminicola]